MSLIICPECGKEYSDRASACPNCACPTPLPHCAESCSDSHTAKTRSIIRPIIITIVIIALLAAAGKYVHKVYLYNNGLNAMNAGDYSTARKCLEDLNFQDSGLIMNDVSFLEMLEEIVHNEIAYDSEMEYIINSAENNLNNLRKYKAVDFYTDGLSMMLDQYIEGLERIIGAFDYEIAASIQYELLAGKYYCDYVVVTLHNGIGFMQNSSKYAEVYADILSKEEAMLMAYEELNEKGHVVSRNGEFQYIQIKLYLRNDTKYSFDQTYIFDFYNYNGGKLLDTVTVNVFGIEPNADYTVCINVPQSARNGYSVNYSYYYLDVAIPD